MTKFTIRIEVYCNLITKLIVVALAMCPGDVLRAQVHHPDGHVRIPVVTALTITDFSPRNVVNERDDSPESASGRMRALAATPDGRRVYAIAANTGVWRSNDGGQSWCQLTSIIPCADGQPASAIPVPVLYDIAVGSTPAIPTPNPNPGVLNLRTDPVVLVAAGYDTRVNSLAGIYRSIDGGGTWTRVHTFACGGAVKPAYQVRFAPDDPSTAWASGGCGIARSDDGGRKWDDVSPTPGLDVSHIVISERDRNGAHWVYAWGGTETNPSATNAIYVSADGGRNWQAFSTPAGRPYGYRDTPHVLATWPGQPNRLFVALRDMSNGFRIFDECLRFDTRCNQVANTPPPGAPANCPKLPRLVQCGEGGLFWADFSPGTFTTSPHSPHRSDISPPAPNTHARPEPPRIGAAPLGLAWFQVASPPNYFGQGTPSGAPFVITKARPGGGFLLFFGDGSTVHVHEGFPPVNITAARWHRLDGWDPWASLSGTASNFIHSDPFDLAVSPDFDVDLVSPPCDAELRPPCINTATTSSRGKIWIANDGGVYSSSNLASADKGGWTAAARGLNTLSLLGATVLARPGARRVAIYTGTTDNNELYFNADTRGQWVVPELAGDTAPYYSDALLTDRVVATDHCRSPLLAVFPDTLSVLTPGTPLYPDIAFGSCSPAPPSVQYPVGANVDLAPGNLPVVQTMPGESSVVDLVMIGKASPSESDSAVLYRNLNNLETDRGVPWVPVRPDNTFPPDARVVQASGGHAAPTYYIQTGAGELYKGRSVAPYRVADWSEIVPGGGACQARRFFVDPYDPAIIYLDDPMGNCGGSTGKGIKISTDGGSTWRTAQSLQSVLTNATAGVSEFSTDPNPKLQGGARRWDGMAGPQGGIINGMVFLPSERGTRFAVGITGAFVTVDGGTTWQRLFADAELPCTASAAAFDGVSTPGVRSLYVFCFGRGVLKLDGIPPPARVGTRPPDTTSRRHITHHNQH